MMGEIELLAPAGTYETFCAVLNAGADAIYAGGTKFGARAYAGNFSEEQLKNAIQIAHLNSRRFYLTVNTLLKNRELEEQLFEYLRPYYEIGLDGVIVQDFGVASFCRTNFPKMELHASTQMSVYGSEGAAFLKEQGFSQVVLPRELSLDEIREIHEKTDIKLECFIHGALCYSYSGQCLFSSLLGGRSGNRGRCAQPCRLAYGVCGADGSFLRTGYPLSLKDVCALNELPDLIEAGVSSLKIEGRMKQAEYAAGVTHIYRTFLDEFLQKGKENFHLGQNAFSQLLELGNRSGFTNGYLVPKADKEMISWEKPSHQKGKKDGFIKEIKENYLKDVPKTPISMRIQLKIGEPMQLTIHCGNYSVTVSGAHVADAMKQPVTEKVIFDKLRKLGNTPFEVQEIEVNMDDNIFCSMTALNQLRRDGIEKLLELFADKRTAYEVMKDSSDTEYDFFHSEKEDYADGTYRIEADEVNQQIKASGTTPLYVSVFTKEQFQSALSCSEVTRIYVDCHGFLEEEYERKLIGPAKAAGKEIFLMMPVVFRQKQQKLYQNNLGRLKQFDGFLIRALDEIPFLLRETEGRRLVLDANLYTWNNRSQKFFASLGIHCNTVPFELNEAEIRHRRNTRSEMVIYGYYPLMTSAQCVAKNTGSCKKNHDTLYLKDRYKKDFPVKMLCDICTNRIYNTVPTALFKQAEKIKKLGCEAYRMDFVFETKEEMELCIKKYKEAFLMETVSETNPLKDITYGHFKRGVE